MADEPQQAKKQDADTILETYCDSLNISTGLYTVSLELGELLPDDSARTVARIKVSPQMLKAIALLTNKHVRAYEERTGQQIKLPNELLHGWGLEEEIS